MTDERFDILLGNAIKNFGEQYVTFDEALLVPHNFFSFCTGFLEVAIYDFLIWFNAESGIFHVIFQFFSFFY